MSDKQFAGSKPTAIGWSKATKGEINDVKKKQKLRLFGDFVLGELPHTRPGNREGREPEHATPQKKVASKKNTTESAVVAAKGTKRKAAADAAPIEKAPTKKAGACSVNHSALSNSNTDNLAARPQTEADDQDIEGEDIQEGAFDDVGEGGVEDPATVSKKRATKATRGLRGDDGCKLKKYNEAADPKNIRRPDFNAASVDEATASGFLNEPSQQSKDPRAAATKAGHCVENKGVVGRDGFDGAGMVSDAMSVEVVNKETAAETVKKASNEPMVPQTPHPPAAPASNLVPAADMHEPTAGTVQEELMPMVHYNHINWDTPTPTFIPSANAYVMRDTPVWKNGGQVHTLNMGNGHKNDVMVCDTMICTKCSLVLVDTNLPSLMKNSPFVHSVETELREGVLFYKPKPKPLAPNTVTPGVQKVRRLLRFSSYGKPFDSWVNVCMGCVECMNATIAQYQVPVDPMLGELVANGNEDFMLGNLNDFALANGNSEKSGNHVSILDSNMSSTLGGATGVVYGYEQEWNDTFGDVGNMYDPIAGEGMSTSHNEPAQFEDIAGASFATAPSVGQSQRESAPNATPTSAGMWNSGLLARPTTSTLNENMIRSSQLGIGMIDPRSSEPTPLLTARQVIHTGISKNVDEFNLNL